MREKFESAHVQFTVPAQCVTQSAFRFRERRRIEDDQIELGLPLFRRAQEREDVFLDPFDRQAVALGIAPRVRETFRTGFHRRH